MKRGRLFVMTLAIAALAAGAVWAAPKKSGSSARDARCADHT